MLFKDFLFPKFCVTCGKFGKYICSTCSQGLVFLPDQRCFYCQQLSHMGLTHLQCRQQNGVDGFMAIFKYNDFLRKIIKMIKYRLAADILDELIFLAKEKIVSNLTFFLDLEQETLFQPIPLHKQRLRERGFNQAQLIIERLEKQIGKVIKANVLIRQRNTFAQAQISDKKERLRNIRGAFAIAPQIEPPIQKTFFLVDDVVTTGSTTKEAAACLKFHQATKVYVFSLAKG